MKKTPKSCQNCAQIVKRKKQGIKKTRKILITILIIKSNGNNRERGGKKRIKGQSREEEKNFEEYAQGSGASFSILSLLV